jgi:murein DD-endopeptidase MepM/ murein hydrolase activator NlpD
MSFKFTSHKLLGGLFEPEGIYLAPPVDGDLVVLHGWGEASAAYSQWRYNGVPLKGHTGIDFALLPAALLLATDGGRVVELAVERGGFERYIKIEHRWGESLYAHVGELLVESGQTVQRGAAIARGRTGAQPANDSTASSAAAPAAASTVPLFFHFGVRVSPFNRYDGWGGFTDPTPYLPPGSLTLARDDGDGEGRGGRRDGSPGSPLEGPPLHVMADERQGIRRP